MFHVMGSLYNNNSSSTELKKTPAYLRPPRRPLKETPPPWKDALKHSCLERARRERQKDAISSRRRRHCHFHDFHHERARNVVQEELHECGIGIRGGGGEEEEMEQVMQRPYTTETPRENDKEQQQQQDDDEYEISQDELYELMQQVEEELLRQESRLVEEAELCEQLSRQHLEHQIQEFQDWQLLQSPQEECGDVVVVCPLCHDTNLVELPAGGGVACPNAAACCCLLQLPQAKSLENVRERLGAAFEMHNNCSSPLELVVVKSTGDDNKEHLVANCHVCDYHLVIV